MSGKGTKLSSSGDKGLKGTIFREHYFLPLPVLPTAADSVDRVVNISQLHFSAFKHITAMKIKNVGEKKKR